MQLVWTTICYVNRSFLATAVSQFLIVMHNPGRVCRHSSERYASGGAMDGGGEARIGFIVTGSDAPKLLEPLEAVLDEMPPFVHLKIMWEGSFPVSLGE